MPIKSHYECETTRVKDFDLTSPTVMRPGQSLVFSVGEPSGLNFLFRNPVFRWATIMQLLPYH